MKSMDPNPDLNFIQGFMQWTPAGTKLKMGPNIGYVPPFFLFFFAPSNSGPLGVCGPTFNFSSLDVCC